MVQLALCLIPVVVFCCAAFADDAPRKPVPDTKAQAAALALVKVVFKDDYAAKAPDKKLALARNLLKQAGESASDPAGQYVLLREAAEVAAAQGDADTALRAVAEMEAGFAVERDVERGAVLAKLAAAAKTPEANKAVAEELSALADRAAASGDFEKAAAEIAAAEKAATKAKDVALLSSVRKRRDGLAAAKMRFAKVAKFAETLKDKPDDPEANLEIGRYECFVRGDWKAGLPKLAKGSDPSLKALAAKSLAAGEEAAVLTEIAGAWWTLGDGLAGAEREAVREYAADRYRAALPNLSGLAKAVAEKRIAEAGKPASGAAPRLGRRTVDLIPLIDASKDALGGTWKVEKGALRCETGSFVPKVQLPYQPPEEYDFSVTFSQPGLRNGISLIMPDRHGNSFYWAVASGNGTEYFLPFAGGKTGKLPPAAAIKAGTVHTTLVQVRKDGLKAYLDGKLLGEVKTDFKDFKSDGWHDIKDKTLLAVACDDPTVFSAVQVIEISGPGKRTR